MNAFNGLQPEENEVKIVCVTGVVKNPNTAVVEAPGVVERYCHVIGRS